MGPMTSTRWLLHTRPIAAAVIALTALGCSTDTAGGEANAEGSPEARDTAPEDSAASTGAEPEAAGPSSGAVPDGAPGPGMEPVGPTSSEPSVSAPIPAGVPPGSNYGDERIGYKQQSSTDEASSSPDSDQGLSAAGGSSAAPVNDPFGAGGSGGTGIVAEPEPVSEPESMDAGSDVPLATDAGPEDGGLAVAQQSTGSESDALQPENPFRVTTEMAASTFSIDVDTGSYTLARAALNQGALPDPSTVRIEEFINYFHLHYAQPPEGVPFSVYTELGACPWAPEHELLLVGIQGQEVPLVDQPAANLVFLLDVSGSMNEANKLPLLKKGFRMLTRQLRPIDRVSIVTYASSDTVVIEGVPGDQYDTIVQAIDQLQAGGSTNGEGGIQRAYQIAQEHFIEGGNNRVLLATDGDFNVGLSNTEELAGFISEKRGTGVFLSVFGFGSPLGNFMDGTAEQLADNGNGIYFFIDGPEEARRAFIETATGALLTVAKDVKLQLEYNPELVAGYRLIGYENRVLANSDFSNDFVDAGELGAGLSVTALFEIIPAGSDLTVPAAVPGTDPLEAASENPAAAGGEAEFAPVTGEDLVEVRIRYKGRDVELSELIAQRYAPLDLRRDGPTRKFAFASAVAELGMQLRGSQYLPVTRTTELYEQISIALPAEEDGAVTEFLGLAKTAHEL